MEKNKMKISKGRLKQIIREELQTVLGEADKNAPFLSQLITKAKAWIPLALQRDSWTEEEILGDPLGAWSEVIREVISFWNFKVEPGLSPGQKTELKSGNARMVLKKLEAKVALAERGKKVKDPGEDLEYFVPVKKDATYVKNTPFARKFFPEEEEYSVSPEDFDL
tara:strand:+ start:65 stop:562 length:498 start_codon:yes stop_codon:yes gene_type:complete